MQLPSHWLSWGQTRPQTDGSDESRNITPAAASKSPALTLPMKAGISIETGHMAMHPGFLHLMHLTDSLVASSRLYPRQTSSKLVFRIWGSCTRTGTLLFEGILQFYIFVRDCLEHDL
jgi:hypothetical protein